MVKYVYYDGKFTTLPKYIYQRRNGWFEIRKRIGGIVLYWGSFPFLEQAKMYLAYYIGKNWEVNPHFMDMRYIREQDGKYIVLKRNGDSNPEYFGTFDNLDDAKRERDICVACNWDLDVIVEFGDVIEV